MRACVRTFFPYSLAWLLNQTQTPTRFGNSTPKQRRLLPICPFIHTFFLLYRQTPFSSSYSLPSPSLHIQAYTKQSNTRKTNPPFEFKIHTPGYADKPNPTKGTTCKCMHAPTLPTTINDNNPPCTV